MQSHAERAAGKRAAGKNTAGKRAAKIARELNQQFLRAGTAV
jgi:hypothetical protein